MGVLPFREILIKKRISFLHQILNEEKDSIMYRFLQTQLKSMSSKDWITQVLKDIKDINLNLSLEEIKVMKKSELKKILKKMVADVAFERLQKLKENHSKVINLKYHKLEMQMYLKASQHKLKQEDAQMIFNLRSRMTEVKINYRGRYENFECEACKINEESQMHITECKEIIKLRKEYKKPPEYSKLFNGSVKTQLEIAKDFTENMKIKENLNKKK
jgi:hypothetical protein